MEIITYYCPDCHEQLENVCESGDWWWQCWECDKEIEESKALDS